MQFHFDPRGQPYSYRLLVKYAESAMGFPALWEPTICMFIIDGAQEMLFKLLRALLVILGVVRVNASILRSKSQNPISQIVFSSREKAALRGKNIKGETRSPIIYEKGFDGLINGIPKQRIFLCSQKRMDMKFGRKKDIETRFIVEIYFLVVRDPWKITKI